jgi:arabinofuranosyltransferase
MNNEMYKYSGLSSHTANAHYWDERERQFGLYSMAARIYRKIFKNTTDMKLCVGSIDPVNEVRALKYKGDIIEWATGVLVYYYADGIYINDTIALGDPFLARLPAIYTKGWTVGHIRREIPEGYRESIQTGENRIKDRNLAEYLDVIWEITRSEKIFTKSRIRKIININLGKYNYLIDRYMKSKVEEDT